MSYRELVNDGQRVWNQKVDPVYRIMDRMEYLDDFFLHGRLRLTSLAHFRRYPDEEAGDPGEGTGVLLVADEGGAVKAVSHESSMNAYVLCTTAHLSPEVINAFNGVGAIKINDPTRFGTMIAAGVPDCWEGVEGHCDYVDHRVDALSIASVDGKRFFEADPKMDQPLLKSIVHKHTGKAAFMKPSRYAYQREYRFLWFTKRPVTEALVVSAPWARETCELIMF